MKIFGLRADNILDGEAAAGIVNILLQPGPFQQLQQGGPIVPWQIGRPFDDVVAFQCANGQIDDILQLKCPGDLRVIDNDIVVAVLGVVYQIHFVYCDDYMGDIEQGRDDGMAPGLFDDAIPRVDENDDQVGVGCAGHHIASVLDMSGGVGDDEFAVGRGKIFVGNVDGDALLTFGAQAVCEEGEVDLTVFFITALPFE